MITILVTVVVILYAINYLIHNSKNGKIFDKIPGVRDFPLLGNVTDLMSESVPLFYSARLLANVSRFKENICRMWMLNKKVVNIYDPDDIEVLLSSPKFITKGYTYQLIDVWMKEGLLTSTGEKWQKRRKILTPTFHFNILRQFCRTFLDESEKLVNKILIQEVGKNETEILPYITNFTLHSICETAMGCNLDTEKSIVKSYKQAIYDLQSFLIYRFPRLWLYPHFIYYNTPTGKVEMTKLKILHEFTTNIIRERRSNLKDLDTLDDSQDEDLGIKKKRAMLDLLLKAESEGQINEDGIREEVDTFMFEGHDTITMALTFFLMVIANYADIQERIVAELNQVLGDNKSRPSIEDLNNLNYLEMCFKESLRLYPSVPFISRQLYADMQLKKYLVPAGTECFLHIYDVHRNPNLYPNPDRYDPDRFLPENSRDRHPYAYIPFSAGPRNCIGQRFAMLEAKAAICAILRNFKLEPVTRPEDIIFCCDIVLRPKDPIKVKFLPRVTI